MRRQVIVYMSPVFILLSTFTSIARLKWLSLLGNAFMTIALGSAIVASLSHVSEESIATATGLEPGFTEINLFVGSIFFTFEGLGTVMPVCNAFADSERFPGVLVKSMGALATSFLIVGACVSLGYPELSSGSVVAFFQHELGGPYWIGINGVVTLAIILTYPLQLFPAAEVRGMRESNEKMHPHASLCEQGAR